MRPYGLFVKGELPNPNAPAVAIIGARRCTHHGGIIAEHTAAELTRAGILIISGLAIGIDSCSHQGALSAGGKTYAVMGCGPDICYPSSHRNLYEQIASHGGILSEYPPGREVRPAYFPLRNRIISGLADLVLVVEARERSGSLITVDQALEQGREVMAVPGRPDDPLSVGCNRLIPGRVQPSAQNRPMSAVFSVWIRTALGKLLPFRSPLPVLPANERKRNSGF